jgi:hypothetical protein
MESWSVRPGAWVLGIGALIGLTAGEFLPETARAAGAATQAAAVATRPIVLARAGASSYRIVVPNSASPAVEYAAAELQSFVEQIAGARLSIVPEHDAGTGPSVLLGPCEKTRRAGVVQAAGRLEADGVLIRSLGRDLVLIGGNERGHLYSVYVLLEKYLGVRFLAWDCTVVPRRAELALPELNYTYAPPFMYRETLYFNSFPRQIAARQRLNGPATKCDATTGGKIDFYPYVHSFDDLFPEKDYFKDHPEYYGLQGGKRVAGVVHAQLCLTNPDVLRLAKEKVLRWIDEHPDVPIIDVSQNDGNGACECDQCTAIVKAEGSQQGTILRFVNAIADEVARKHPDKWVETLAYAYSMNPPAITRPRPNVIIRLCHAGCFLHGFETCRQGAELATWVDQWSRLTRRIFIWHYGTNFAHYLAPNPNLNGLVKDIRFYAAHGVNGLMVQCDYQGPGGELAELRQYLCAQLMWDPAQDPMRVREEFCRGYYGRAAEAVLEFLRRMDTASEQPLHIFAVWDPTAVVDPGLARDALRTLERARAESNDDVTRRRVGKLMLPFWYTLLLSPAKYGLTDAEAAALWQRARQVIAENGITFIRESGAPNGDAAGWVAEMDARFAPAPKGLIRDLLRIGDAKTEHCADWRTASVSRGGRLVRTIFQHPDGRRNGDATYEIPLPTQPQGGRLVLKFATVISNATGDGVRFAVLVDGSEVWHETQTLFLPPAGGEVAAAHDAIAPGRDPFSDHVVDLTAHAGHTIRLTLRVNAIGDNSNDWANWVEPRVIQEP